MKTKTILLIHGIFMPLYRRFFKSNYLKNQEVSAFSAFICVHILNG